jgi:hypothetical protein
MYDAINAHAAVIRVKTPHLLSKQLKVTSGTMEAGRMLEGLIKTKQCPAFYLIMICVFTKIKGYPAYIWVYFQSLGRPDAVRVSSIKWYLTLYSTINK